MMTEIFSDDTNSLLRRTLWGADGRLLEAIENTHIFNSVLEMWNRDKQAAVCTTPLPGPSSQARNTADKSSKPMTQPINLVPVKIAGGFAMQFGDVRSQQIYEQWKLKVDSMPDYLATMARRGRYVGRIMGGIA